MSPRPVKPLPLPSRRGFRLRLASGLALLNLAVLAFLVFSLVQSRRDHLRRTEVATRNLAKGAERAIQDTLDKADMLLLATQDEWTRQLGNGGLNASRLEFFMARQQSRLPLLSSLRIADAAGRIRYGTGVAAAPPASVADRDYFQQLSRQPQAGLVVSSPAVGRISNRWVLMLARRLEGPDGAFQGVVYAVLPLEHIRRGFAALDLGREGTLSLWDEHLALVVRHPALPGPEAGERRSSRLFLETLKGGPHATSRALSTLDGVRRVFTLRHIQGHPLHVLAGLGESEALAGWRRECFSRGLMGLGFLGLSLLVARLADRQWARQRQAAEAIAREEAKYRAVFEHAFEGIHQMDLEGHLVACNPAFATLMGYASTDEMMREAPDVARHLVDPAAWPLLRETLLQEGTAQHLELEALRRDGERLWLLVNLHLVKDARGVPRLLEGTSLDITARKRRDTEREVLIAELREALAEVQTLSGLLPICSACKKVRDDQGYWTQIEAYITARSQAQFTHGICPDCATKLFPGFGRNGA